VVSMRGIFRAVTGAAMGTDAGPAAVMVRIYLNSNSPRTTAAMN